MNDTIFKTAFALAQEAFTADEVPVGAVVFNTSTGEIIAVERNRTEEYKSPLAHAEILAIHAACATTRQKRLTGYSLFVTLEPCTMCAGAIAWARLDALYFGAYDPKTGAVEQGPCVFTHPQIHHKITVHGGFHADECGLLMTRFFQQKRKKD